MSFQGESLKEREIFAVGQGGEVCSLLSDLLFGLCFLDVVSAHFDPRGQDGSGELHDVHAKQVTELLRSWGTQKERTEKINDILKMF